MSQSVSAARGPRSVRRARVFLSYKHSVEPDVAFTRLLAKALAGAGCEVLWDQQLLPTRNWEAGLDELIPSCDVFLLVLTHSSASSDNIKAELHIADETAKSGTGRPAITAIRVAYTKRPPYSILAKLLTRQQLEWNDEADTACVLEKLFALMLDEGFQVDAPGGRKAAEGVFLSDATNYARSLRAALQPLAGESQIRRGAVDETLFLALTLDGLYKAVLLQIPPDEFHGTTLEEFDEMFQEMRMHVAVLSRYARSRGKPAGLREGFEDLVDVIDTHLDVTRKQRDLREAERLAIGQAQRAQQAEQREALKGKELSGMEVLAAGANFFTDSLSRSERVQLEYRGKHRELRQEFNRRFDDAYADTKMKLHELAKKYGWAEGEWHFEARSAAWEEIRKLTFQRKFAARARLLSAVLEEHPNDFWTVGFYLHNVAAEGEGETRRRVRMAARAALMVPDAFIFDEEREALAIQAAQTGMQMLTTLQCGRRLGEADVGFAGQVYELLRVFETHNPDLMKGSRAEWEVFALAAAGRLEDALARGEDCLRAGSRVPGLRYTMARLASRLNRVDKALQWLREAMRAREIGAEVYSGEADLATLRTALPAEFKRMIEVKCEVVCDRGFMAYDILLKNTSPFPLRGLELTADMPDGEMKKLSFAGPVASQGTKKWGWQGAVTADRNRQVPVSFYVRCAEGETSRVALA